MWGSSRNKVGSPLDWQCRPKLTPPPQKNTHTPVSPAPLLSPASPFPLSPPHSSAAFPLDAVAVDVDERLRQLDAQEEERRRLQALRSRKGVAAATGLVPAPDGGPGGGGLTAPSPIGGAERDVFTAAISTGGSEWLPPSSGHHRLGQGSGSGNEAGPWDTAGGAASSTPVAPSSGLSPDSGPPPTPAASPTTSLTLPAGRGGVCFPPLPPLHQRPQRPPAEGGTQ